ncbi:hypothetical protein KPB05_38030 [Burkholderia gladioli]|uniref:hypothetical protein n=1 Tax=Burkholderia gladioli TaxID=28095 RepID=UPI002862070E|nr:hypothetical protein [Burkholderia gladioli]MDR8093261.1 hypothetical protein [Burkholderia gladioli]
MRGLRFLTTTVDCLIVTADRHPAGALSVLRLAGFGCGGVGLAVLNAALELVRSAVVLVGGGGSAGACVTKSHRWKLSLSPV